MTGDQARLIQAVVAGLGADAAARALLGDPARVWDEPPRGAAFPHVQIGRCDSRSLGGEGGAVEHQLVLTGVSRFAGMEEARAVAAVVEDVLGRLALDGGGLVSCEVRSVTVSRSRDLGRAWAVMRVRAVTDGG